VRRKDREKSAEFALGVVDTSAFSTLATVNGDGSPYCIPFSPAREGEWLYFHSAPDGQKIDNLRRLGKVCVSCAGDIKVIPGKFGIEYKSAVIKGTASEITGNDEKIRALKIISERYTPDDMPLFDDAIKASLERTAVFKIHIDEITGKERVK